MKKYKLTNETKIINSHKIPSLKEIVLGDTSKINKEIELAKEAIKLAKKELKKENINCAAGCLKNLKLVARANLYSLAHSLSEDTFADKNDISLLIHSLEEFIKGIEK